MAKEEACGKRKIKDAPGVKGKDGDEIIKFIKDHGTDAAKRLVRGKKPSRPELCVILHSFRAGRELIAASGARSNFRMTPSPNRSSNSSSNSNANVPKNKSPVRIIAPAGLTAAQERAFWRAIPASPPRSKSPNLRTNAERELNNFMKRMNMNKMKKTEENLRRKEGESKEDWKKRQPKKEKSYRLHGVSILGSRPTGKQIKDALARKNVVVGRAGNSSSSNNNKSVRSAGASSAGSSNRSLSSPNSNRSNNNSNNVNSRNSGGSNRNNNGGGSDMGNGINRSHYQNLTAKRNKTAKVKQIGSRLTLKKKKVGIIGPFCLRNPNSKVCRSTRLRKNNYWRLPVGKGRGTLVPAKHRGTKTKSVKFMNFPVVGGNNVTKRIPTRIGSHFTHGSRARVTKSQLRIANDERWRRYAIMTKNMNNNDNKSALANKLMVEAVANVMAGKVTSSKPPHKVYSGKRLRHFSKADFEKVKEMRRVSKAQSELGKVFSKSYMTGHQVEPYYKPLKPKTVKKKNSSNSNSSSGYNSGSNSNSKK